MRARLRQRMGLLSLALLVGCATTTTAPKFGPEDTLRFEFWGRAAPGPVPLRNLAVGEDAAVGGGVGGTAGALSGLGCGWLAPICVPVLALVGLGTGSATGGAIGLTGALPADKRESLVARVDRQLKVQELQQRLAQDLLPAARQRWTVTASGASTLVLIELRTIELTSNRAEQIGLNARVRTTVRLSASPQGDAFQKEFNCNVAPSPVEAWIGDSTDHVDQQLVACTRQLSGQILTALGRS